MWLTINVRAQTDTWFLEFLFRFGDGVGEIIDGNYVRIPDCMTIQYTDEVTSKRCIDQ